MQFWQHCWRILTQSTKICRSKSKKLQIFSFFHFFLSNVVLDSQNGVLKTLLKTFCSHSEVSVPNIPKSISIKKNPEMMFRICRRPFLLKCDHVNCGPIVFFIVSSAKENLWKMKTWKLRSIWPKLWNYSSLIPNRGFQFDWILKKLNNDTVIQYALNFGGHPMYFYMFFGRILFEIRTDFVKLVTKFVFLKAICFHM